MRFVFAIFLSIFYIQNSQAIIAPPPPDDCTNGVIARGTFRLNNGNIEYCGAYTMWGTVDNGAGSGACPAGNLGSQRYNAGTMEFCNGTTWRTMDVCATDTACTKAGAQFLGFSSGASFFCNGSVWHTLAPSSCQTTITCQDLATSKDCGDKGSCFWTGNYCGVANDCTTYYDSAGCNSNPVCTWNAGSCGSGI